MVVWAVRLRPAGQLAPPARPLSIDMQAAHWVSGQRVGDRRPQVDPLGFHGGHRQGDEQLTEKRLGIGDTDVIKTD